MGKKESISNRRYTEEFKTEAVRLALSRGGNAAAKPGALDCEPIYSSAAYSVESRFGVLIGSTSRSN